MNDDTRQGCMVMVVAIAMTIFGAFLGSMICNSAWEKSAKSRGVMKYNEATGVLEWKVKLESEGADGQADE